MRSWPAFLACLGIFSISLFGQSTEAPPTVTSKNADKTVGSVIRFEVRDPNDTRPWLGTDRKNDPLSTTTVYVYDGFSRRVQSAQRQVYFRQGVIDYKAVADPGKGRLGQDVTEDLKMGKVGGEYEGAYGRVSHLRELPLEQFGFVDLTGDNADGQPMLRNGKQLFVLPWNALQERKEIGPTKLVAMGSANMPWVELPASQGRSLAQDCEYHFDQFGWVGKDPEAEAIAKKMEDLAKASSGGSLSLAGYAAAQGISDKVLGLLQLAPGERENAFKQMVAAEARANVTQQMDVVFNQNFGISREQFSTAYTSFQSTLAGMTMFSPTDYKGLSELQRRMVMMSVSETQGGAGSEDPTVLAAKVDTLIAQGKDAVVKSVAGLGPSYSKMETNMLASENQRLTSQYSQQLSDLLSYQDVAAAMGDNFNAALYRQATDQVAATGIVELRGAVYRSLRLDNLTKLGGSNITVYYSGSMPLLIYRSLWVFKPVTLVSSAPVFVKGSISFNNQRVVPGAPPGSGQTGGDHGPRIPNPARCRSMTLKHFLILGCALMVWAACASAEGDDAPEIWVYHDVGVTVNSGGREAIDAVTGEGRFNAGFSDGTPSYMIQEASGAFYWVPLTTAGNQAFSSDADAFSAWEKVMNGETASLPFRYSGGWYEGYNSDYVKYHHDWFVIGALEDVFGSDSKGGKVHHMFRNVYSGQLLLTGGVDQYLNNLSLVSQLDLQQIKNGTGVLGARHLAGSFDPAVKLTLTGTLINVGPPPGAPGGTGSLLYFSLPVLDPKNLSPLPFTVIQPRN